MSDYLKSPDDGYAKSRNSGEYIQSPEPAPQPKQQGPNKWQQFWGGMAHPFTDYDQWLAQRNKKKLNWLQRLYLHNMRPRSRYFPRSSY